MTKEKLNYLLSVEILFIFRNFHRISISFTGKTNIQIISYLVKIFSTRVGQDFSLYIL